MTVVFHGFDVYILLILPFDKFGVFVNHFSLLTDNILIEVTFFTFCKLKYTQYACLRISRPFSENVHRDRPRLC